MDNKENTLMNYKQAVKRLDFLKFIHFLSC